MCVLGVKQACCEFLESQLDPSNCLGIRDFAETHNCVDLMQAAEVFSQKHFPEVVQHEEFILLSQGEVEKLIKCDEIQVQGCLGVTFLYITEQDGVTVSILWLHNQIHVWMPKVLIYLHVYGEENLPWSFIKYMNSSGK